MGLLKRSLLNLVLCNYGYIYYNYFNHMVLGYNIALRYHMLSKEEREIRNVVLEQRNEQNQRLRDIWARDTWMTHHSVDIPDLLTEHYRLRGMSHKEPIKPSKTMGRHVFVKKGSIVYSNCH